jgi:hypothetical protein
LSLNLTFELLMTLLGVSLTFSIVPLTLTLPDGGGGGGAGHLR